MAQQFKTTVLIMVSMLLIGVACNLPGVPREVATATRLPGGAILTEGAPTATLDSTSTPSSTASPELPPTPEIKGEPIVPDGSVFVDATHDLLPDVVNVNYGTDFADIDGDGSVDIWVADCGRLGDQVLLNDGNGVFADVTAERLNRPGASDHWSRTSYGEDVVFVDVDGDGDQDAYVNSRPHLPDGSVWAEALFLNDGAGGFTDEIEFRLPTEVFAEQGISGLAELGDVDGDGDMDLVRTTRFHRTTMPGQLGRTGLYLNDGSGVFTDATNRVPDDSGTHTSGLGLADVNLDGYLDIVLENSPVEANPDSVNELRVYLNEGDGHFRDASAELLPAPWREGLNAAKFALGDLEGDDDIDIISSNVILRYAQDAGRFVADHQTPVKEGAGLAIVGDVNVDGYPDIIATQFRQVGDHGAHDPVLLLNARNGSFEAPQKIAEMPAGTVIQEMGLADLDGDGDPELYVGTGVPPHDHPGQEGMEGGTQLDRLFVNTFNDAQASR